MTNKDRLQLWGGLECTINRVGDYWYNQDQSNGHGERGVRDLPLFESLHIPTVRYPVLWEAVAFESPDELRFEGVDERMKILQGSAIEPIVGLLHHGSGPSYTSLVDPDFPEKLASYASRVAERYPWVTYYTPVNEPLTTARFSGLYGVWYPHGRDDATFARALYNEIKGTVLAMRAIRAVNPAAKLVQTDDLGRASGTPATQRQVDFENDRRWLGFDLLMGKVAPGHPLYHYLVTDGALTGAELAWLAQNPMPPDVIGLNHYLLSNRFLDDELEWYPDHVQIAPTPRCDVRYADVPALESARADSPSVYDVLRDAWERYPDTPLAVTEVHIDGESATQLQWLWDVWQAATRLREEGAPMVAVTAWSLLGTYDWNTLCTSPSGGHLYYEPGVFDVSSGFPQPTLLTDMVRALAKHGTFEHPALSRRGYWHGDDRFKYALARAEELAS
jgi:dTDP-4-dehydrorhamnose reductase